MLRTILIGTCVSIQGILVRTLANGMLVVRVGDRIYTGRPVSPA
ncbi:hypothetical protein OG2516_11146 [Oceanicola granulosus HTCC2516]|uniref:Uncharacterized protein n=1 Tax=Oceanicola granulosus (strain ATCC BAA-861 / DSM 15982 / KCTC 12143 / HTCC2516) TaxID=314256 RepID=Q2CJX4_OCEGH|nr:hypothetical protein [Oceanicola granulosus]EAR53015.1 hypothetical protein OG2516_11146 [Oceanicola granulosus HTCC2516]